MAIDGNKEMVSALLRMMLGLATEHEELLGQQNKLIGELKEKNALGLMEEKFEKLYEKNNRINEKNNKIRQLIKQKLEAKAQIIAGASSSQTLKDLPLDKMQDSLNQIHKAVLTQAEKWKKLQHQLHVQGISLQGASKEQLQATMEALNRKLKELNTLNQNFKKIHKSEVSAKQTKEPKPEEPTTKPRLR